MRLDGGDGCDRLGTNESMARDEIHVEMVLRHLLSGSQFSFSNPYHFLGYVVAGFSFLITVEIRQRSARWESLETRRENHFIPPLAMRDQNLQKRTTICLAFQKQRSSQLAAEPEDQHSACGRCKHRTEHRETNPTATLLKVDIP